MTAVIVHDLDERLETRAGAPTRPLDYGPTMQRLTELQPDEIAVLALFDGPVELLSCSQMARRAGLSLSDARSAARTLCSLGMLRRLNTVVEGYIAGAPRVT